MGYSLRLLQWGEQPTDYRPLPSVGKGLFELRDRDKDGWYRVIYLSRTNDCIHVVHVFEKDTRQIPENEKAVARQNLSAVNAYLREEKKRAKKKNEPTYVTKGDVLDDLGFSPEQTAALKFKADLYQAIMRYSKKYSPKELEIIFAEPQPRVSELLNGKIANKSVDKLLGYAGRLGIVPKARFPQTNKDVVKRELAAAAGA